MKSKIVVLNGVGLMTALTLFVIAAVGATGNAYAGEDFFGYLKSSEPLPKHAKEFEFQTTSRSDKGQGTYRAYDAEAEFEYGVTNRFTVSAAVKGQAVHATGLIINGYLPQEKVQRFALSGIEAEAKYNILSAAQDPIGLSIYFDTSYGTLDPHSGQKKDTFSTEPGLILQKYFMEGRLVWIGNIAREDTFAQRKPIDDLDPAIEWSTDPEVEIETRVGTGVTYRFIPKWYLGVETVYEEERETEVGQERWSWFAGPSLHYGSQKWWATLTWFPQIKGGGERYEGQEDSYHLIEKTKQEARFKIGFNF